MNTMHQRYITLVALVALGLLAAACSSDPQDRARDRGQEIWFEEQLHDFGEIEKDGDGSWSFAFKNLGGKALVINRVRSTCGCAVPQWPREPIEPGASGEISVLYDTSKTGTFLKSIIVYSSAANSPVKLQIRGRVVSAESTE